MSAHHKGPSRRAFKKDQPGPKYVLIDTSKRGVVYYTKHASQFTLYPHKATRLDIARAREVQRNWGGTIIPAPKTP